MPIHEQLAALVEATGLTRSEFARRLGVGPPQISNWLNGRVSVPAHRQEQIRRLATQLVGGETVVGSARSASRRASDRDARVDWRFVRANVNAGKDFGNAGIYATPQSVPSLVRETGQNSLDAAVGGSVTLRYTLFELSPGSRRYRRFLEAMAFEESLRAHIEAASTSGGATKIGIKLAAALAALDSDMPLRILRVEDFGAKGLSGDEHDSDQPFSALVRDNLNSRKSQATAGGVFGLGSKTLWACSRLSTVLFSSIVHGEEDDGVRVVGKSDLAWHEDEEGESYAGAGWFGLPVDEDGAESIWLPREDPLLQDLLLDRTPPADESETGTTALIVTFQDPKADDEDGDRILKRFAQAIAENFWPAMVADQMVAFVEHVVDDDDVPRSSVRVDADEYVPAFADAYRRHDRGEVTEKLERIGDTVSVPIQFDVPATRPGGNIDPPHGSLTSECRLLIRLADPALANDRWVDHVGFTRGRAMIVKYERRSGIVTGARPFHAVLLAGTMAGQGTHERAAEQFLRFAEPASHDDWSLNGDLKERYAHGAGVRIKELYDRVLKALQQYVRSETTTSTEGPAILKELFTLRVPQNIGRGARWKLRRVTAVPMDGWWEVSGEVAIDDTSKPYIVRPKLSLDAESGTGLPIAWAELTSGDATSENARLHAEAGTPKVRFTGRTEAVSGVDVNRCLLRIDANVVVLEDDSEHQ